MSMLLWVAALCCFILHTCQAADTNEPVGFKSSQKCREYYQKHYDEIISPPRIYIPTTTQLPIPTTTTTTKAPTTTPDPDRIIFTRSIHSEQTASTQFPFAVLIFDQKNTLRCGGILISDKFVLTAAHCLTNKHFKMTYVDLGTGIVNTETPIYLNISKTIPHPHYNISNLYYSDIGLIELKEPVIFSKTIRPACLSLRVYSDDDDWFLMTWLKGTGDNRNLIKQGKVSIKSAECQQKYQGVDSIVYGIIDRLQICVDELVKEDLDHHASIVVANKNTARYTVVGIPSFGIKYSKTNRVHTRVAGYIKWIESIVWPDEISRGCSKFKFQL